jgi:hypothetical protein
MGQAPTPYHVSNLKTGTARAMPSPFEAQRRPTNNLPVCFAHEGFAVAGAINDNKVRVWDAEHGDQLLSLDHGGKCLRFWENNT